MTEDKDFKQVVRAEARRTGRRYTAVREELRESSAPPQRLAPEEVRARFDAIVETIESWVYGAPELVRLVATALLVPGNVLVRALPGNGMTALGQGVAAAIGGHLFSIDGRTGLDPSDVASWRPDDVVVISHFDGLERADQVAVTEAGRVPAILLAKVHRIPDRMPSPPDDETRERFVFAADLAPGDPETELRILDEARAGAPPRRTSSVVDLAGLRAMRAAAAAVDVPPDVRRFIVDTTAAIRAEDDVVIGPSVIASLALVQATAAAAISAGRSRASVDDARSVKSPVLDHRVVRRS